MQKKKEELKVYIFLFVFASVDKYWCEEKRKKFYAADNSQFSDSIVIFTLMSYYLLSILKHNQLHTNSLHIYEFHERNNLS